MLDMMFIISQIAYPSKAAPFGTFALFLLLALGMPGFVVKQLIQRVFGV
jgi:hypothetical protein